LRLLEEKRVDGVILCSSRLADERLQPLLSRQRAAVVINRPAPPELAASVRIDDAHGIYQAVAHLLKTQRQPIAFLAGPPHAHSSQIRTQAYDNALTAAGISVDPMLIRPCQPDVAGGHHAARELLAASTPIRGIICYNDLVAIGALQACAELGVRVPDEMAVIGCDDILLAGLATPALTTLHVPKAEIGATALRLLLERIEGETHQMETVFTPTLVIRASAP